MRKYLLWVICFTHCFHAYSQPLSDSLRKDSTKQDLIQLVKRQQTTGIILTTAGTVMLSAAFGMSISNLNSIFEPGDDPFDNTTIDVLAVAGIIAVAGGIYMLVRARHNKKKYLNLGFKLQPIYSPQFTGITTKNFPVAQLQIRF